jgi:rubredoxin
MDVKRCDRCGLVYDYDFGKNAMGTSFLLITDETITQLRDSRKYVFRLEGAPTRVMDICPVCAKDYRKWFERMGKRVTE